MRIGVCTEDLRSYRAVSVFLGILAVILLVAATGQEPAFAGELRVLDYDNEGSTSQCIGNPVTPLCAVETLEACTFTRPGITSLTAFWTSFPPPVRPCRNKEDCWDHFKTELRVLS